MKQFKITGKPYVLIVTGFTGWYVDYLMGEIRLQGNFKDSWDRE